MENLTGEGDVSRSQRQWSTYFDGYSDRFWGPAPVASFEPNPFGLYDIGGNVGEWVMDCWHDTYLRAPIDGTAWLNPGCKLRVVRGGNWASSPDQSRAAYRISAKPEHARCAYRIPHRPGSLNRLQCSGPALAISTDVEDQRQPRGCLAPLLLNERPTGVGEGIVDHGVGRVGPRSRQGV